MTNINEIELLFTDLLTQSESALSVAERDEIKEYFDVGEYGLALRTSIAIFREEKKVATTNERLLLLRLAEAMSIDHKTLLNGLPT